MSKTASAPAGIKGRTWLVTGAARGLGLALTRYLAGNGAEVIALAREAGPLSGMAGVRHMACDLARPESFARVADKIAGTRLDTVLHNAALRGDTRGLPHFSPDDFGQVMQVNVAAPLLLTRALIPHLQPEATIAFVSSRAGSCAEGADPDGDYAYCLSKAALNRAVAKLADDLPYRVLALHPGWLRTEMGGDEAPDDPSAAAADLCRLLADPQGPASGRFVDRFGAHIDW